MTEGMDIGFRVYHKDASDGSKKTIVPFSRLNSHMVPEDGSVFCSEPGICTFLSEQLFILYFCTCCSTLNALAVVFSSCVAVFFNNFVLISVFVFMYTTVWLKAVDQLNQSSQIFLRCVVRIFMLLVQKLRNLNSHNS